MTASRRRFLQWAGACSAATVLPAAGRAADKLKRPNILWISLEDIGPELGCYGDPYARSRNIDGIAAAGTRYQWAFTHAAVCAPARCGIITGTYPTWNGGNNMRCRTHLPEGVRCFPEYLRQAGYFCSNHKKKDYQFRESPATWDKNPRNDHQWRARKPGQPFFVVINLTSTHESRIRGGQPGLPAEEKHDPAKAPLPAYHPDTPVVRQAWANYYDNITATDKTVGKILRQLDEDHLADDTIVFFWGDHGSGMTRGKRWVYDSGTRVPILVRVPPKWRAYAKAGKAGAVVEDFVQFLDLAPTVLSLAGVKIPAYMHGRAFLGPQKGKAPETFFAFRDRMDERVDMIRMCRDHEFMYVRNFRWWRPHSQLIGYMRNVPSLAEMWRLHNEGKLTKAQEIFFAPHKPKEELYDVRRDKDQVHNLAGDPTHKDRLVAMRKRSQQWQKETGDLGFIPEPIFEEIKTEPGWRKKVDTCGILDKLHKLCWPLDPPKPQVLAGLLKTRPADLLGESVRYWAMVLMHRHAKTDAARQAVLAAAKGLLASDAAAPCVRVAAAEALAEFADSGEALKVLVEITAHGSEKNALYAIGALERLGPRAVSVLDELQKAKVKGYAARLQPFAALALQGKPLPMTITRKRRKPRKPKPKPKKTSG